MPGEHLADEERWVPLGAEGATGVQHIYATGLLGNGLRIRVGVGAPESNIPFGFCFDFTPVSWRGVPPASGLESDI